MGSRPYWTTNFRDDIRACSTAVDAKAIKRAATADAIVLALARCREPLVEDDTYDVWLKAREYARGKR